VRKYLAAVLTAVLCFGMIAPAVADTSNVAHPNQNPGSTTANYGVRFGRLTLGSALRDFLSLSVLQQGVYANQTIAPGTGMYVTLAPTEATSQGSLYQLLEDSPNPVPADFTPNIPADTTLIGVLASLSSGQVPALGPIAAPGAGESVYYLVEEETNPAVYSNPQTINFVNPQTGIPYGQTYNTQLQDQIVPQLKAGTPASSNPQVPSVDTGFTPIGVILVPSGVTQITSGMISQNNPCGPGSTANCQSFPGFATLGNVVALSAAPSPSPQTGNDALTGQRAGSQFVSTATTGTPPLIVNSTTQVANLNAATAGTAGNVTGIVAQANGGTGTATPGGITCGASGNLSCTGAFPSQTVDLQAALSALTSIGTSAATIGTATITTGSVGSLTASGSFTLPSGLANLSCLGTNGSSVVGAGSCPSVPAFNATTPLTVSSGSGSVTYACPTCGITSAANSWTGNQTVTGTVSATNLAATALPSSQCVQTASSGGALTTSGTTCGPGEIVFDLRAFGAVEGSGGASATDTAFTNAIAAAQAAVAFSGTTTGAFVYIPPTAVDWYCTTAHTIPTNVFFFGVGWSSEIGLSSACAFVTQLDSGVSNVAFNSRGSTATPVLKFQSETYCIHCRFVGSQSSSYVVAPYGFPTSDVQFIGCRFEAEYGSTISGLILLKTTGVSELTVSSSQFIDDNSGDSTTAIQDEGDAAYPTSSQSWTGNTVTGVGMTGTSEFYADASGNLTNIAVVGNVFNKVPTLMFLDNSSVVTANSGMVPMPNYADAAGDPITPAEHSFRFLDTYVVSGTCTNYGTCTASSGGTVAVSGNSEFLNYSAAHFCSIQPAGDFGIIASGAVTNATTITITLINNSGASYTTGQNISLQGECKGP
jgi:hypothetical protein